MSYNAEHNFAPGSTFTACSSAFRKAPSFLSVRSFFISLLNHNLGRGCPELNEITALLIHIALGLTLKPCHGDFNKYARNIIDEKSSRSKKTGCKYLPFASLKRRTSRSSAELLLSRVHFTFCRNCIAQGPTCSTSLCC